MIDNVPAVGEWVCRVVPKPGGPHFGDELSPHLTFESGGWSFKVNAVRIPEHEQEFYALKVVGMVDPNGKQLLVESFAVDDPKVVTGGVGLEGIGRSIEGTWSDGTIKFKLLAEVDGQPPNNDSQR